MRNSTAPRTIDTRPIFVEAYPDLAEAHLKAQRGFFGAGRNAGLNWDRDDQLEGINAALGLRGGHRIVSRKQITPAEYRALTYAIEAGMFSRDWTWSGDFILNVDSLNAAMDNIHNHVHFVVVVDNSPRFSNLVNGR